MERQLLLLLFYVPGDAAIQLTHKELGDGTMIVVSEHIGSGWQIVREYNLRMGRCRITKVESPDGQMFLSIRAAMEEGGMPATKRTNGWVDYERRDDCDDPGADDSNDDSE